VEDATNALVDDEGCRYRLVGPARNLTLCELATLHTGRSPLESAPARPVRQHEEDLAKRVKKVVQEVSPKGSVELIHVGSPPEPFLVAHTRGARLHLVAVRNLRYKGSWQLGANAPSLKLTLFRTAAVARGLGGSLARVAVLSTELVTKEAGMSPLDHVRADWSFDLRPARDEAGREIAPLVEIFGEDDLEAAVANPGTGSRLTRWLAS
jgi:hypothetical protein